MANKLRSQGKLSSSLAMQAVGRKKNASDNQKAEGARSQVISSAHLGNVSSYHPSEIHDPRGRGAGGVHPSRQIRVLPFHTKQKLSKVGENR